MNFIDIINILCIIALVILITIFLESIRENSKYKVTTYDITSKGLPGAFSSYKIVFISDFHSHNKKNYGKRILDEISKIMPDIIVLGGDMITAQMKDNTHMTAEFINSLCDVAPVYYGMGNHERGLFELEEKFGDMWDDYLSQLNLGDRLILLNNNSSVINKGGTTINIYGIELYKNHYKRFFGIKPTDNDIKEMLGDIDKDKFNILIAHTPEFFEEYASWGADLVLSGHVHGGLVQIPKIGGVINPKLRLFPKYDYGEYTSKNNKTKMILSNGLGSHSIKIRVNNIPEIVIINLNSK